jgi:hypothetical protein
MYIYLFMFICDINYRRHSRISCAAAVFLMVDEKLLALFFFFASFFYHFPFLHGSLAQGLLSV